MIIEMKDRVLKLCVVDGSKPGNTIRRKRGKFCPHLDIVVCAEQRTVECGACGATLDPFATIETLSRE